MTRGSSAPSRPEGGDASPCTALQTRFASPNWTRENETLRAQLQQAELIIDVQKKSRVCWA